MERKFIFLLNPISGVGNKSVVKQTIDSVMSKTGYTFELHTTNAEGNYATIRQKIEEEYFTDIVVAGGDGSISAVVAALRDTTANFGILPGGSGNGLALCAGIPKNAEKALEIILTGKPKLTDAFTINNHFSCMLSGLGFDAQVAHDFTKQPTRGLRIYIQQTLNNFFKASPYPFILKDDEGQHLETDAFFISIANSNQFGNGFTIAPEASLQDGLLDIVVVKKMNKLQMLLAVLKQITSGKTKDMMTNDESIVYFTCKHLKIENPGNAPLHVDGDPKGTQPVFDIRIIPQAFRLIYPSKA